MALNGKSLVGVKLAELQSMMYQEDGETVFTLEYDVARQVCCTISCLGPRSGSIYTLWKMEF